MHDTTLSLAAENAVSADDVLRAHFTLTSIDGAIDCIALDGAEGWTSPNPHPALSLMRFNTSDPKRAADALDAILAGIDAESRKLDWMTGPACVAAGHGALLSARGFDPNPMPVAAMSITLQNGEAFDPVEGADAFLVTGPDQTEMGRIMARGFSVPDEVGMIYHRAYMTSTRLQNSDVYGARVNGSDEIVGAGYLSYLGEGETALLRASSVLEDARGKGAYRAMVQRRLIDAAARGCREVFVHAYSKASRLCLSNLGFRTLGGLSIHSRAPRG